MNETVTQINENTWRIEEPMVRAYLLAGKERALLVDSCMNLKGLRALAEELTGLPVQLLNTHGDPDHIGANGDFEHVYMHPDEEPNYRIFGGPGKVIPVSDGDILELGGRPVTIIALPGHTPGSIALLDGNYRTLISGDSVQAGGIVMTGPGRDMTSFIASMKKLESEWMSSFDTVWPAHGPCPVVPDLIPTLRRGAEQILAGELPWEETQLFGRFPARHYRCGTGGFFLPM